MGSLWMSKQKWANFLCTCPSPLLGEIKPPTALKYTPRNILNIRMDSSISSFVACLLPIPSVCGYVSFISISMVKNVSLILLVSFIKVHVLLLVNYEDEALLALLAKKWVYSGYFLYRTKYICTIYLEQWCFTQVLPSYH